MALAAALDSIEPDGKSPGLGESSIEVWQTDSTCKDTREESLILIAKSSSSGRRF
jgi:hypothetical protein